MLDSPTRNLVTGRALLITRRGLSVFLDTLQSLDFSEKGRANVARRFDLSDDELSAVLAAYRKGRNR
ncbi:hypothetical protein HMJ29_06610 [Hymenobacter taeanensis]|uniref:Uncharacterized protein n=1 Tax=Hymenobacter taeanensis TaxID=2735321 RepID=A0A6M6BEH1_9BACT|nr:MULTISPECIES: hypothetical protein [Hymenobacter]QJX46626.1 hypothetical protein HMJ29_06610 [Hymenobacter taeanensis]UOQ80489.1 hypothetical protein MUN83_16950 [Hymenobacter sp. 5414T-23]